MAGVLPNGADDAERERRMRTYMRNLRLACSDAAAQGVTILIEPINARDFPGYLLNTQAQAHAIRTEVGARNLKVQMDLYHAQIVEGDLTEKLRHVPAPYRAHPDRRRTGTHRAGHRRNQLRLPVQDARRIAL